MYFSHGNALAAQASTNLHESDGVPSPQHPRRRQDSGYCKCRQCFAESLSTKAPAFKLLNVTGLGAYDKPVAALWHLPSRIGLVSEPYGAGSEASCSPFVVSQERISGM